MLTLRQEIVAMTFSAMVDHLDDPLANRQLADLGCCSVRALIRAYESELHVPPQRVGFLLRQERAMRELVSTHCPIYVIAARAGYETAFGFRKEFTPLTFCGPQEFRNCNWGANFCCVSYTYGSYGALQSVRSVLPIMRASGDVVTLSFDGFALVRREFHVAEVSSVLGSVRSQIS